MVVRDKAAACSCLYHLMSSTCQAKLASMAKSGFLEVGGLFAFERARYMEGIAFAGWR